MHAGFLVGFHLEHAESIRDTLLGNDTDLHAQNHARKFSARIIKVMSHQALHHHAGSNHLSFVTGEALGILAGKLMPMKEGIFFLGRKRKSL